MSCKSKSLWLFLLSSKVIPTYYYIQKPTGKQCSSQNKDVPWVYCDMSIIAHLLDKQQLQTNFQGKPRRQQSVHKITNKWLFEKPLGTQNESIQRFSWAPDFEVTSFLKDSDIIPKTILGQYFLNIFFCLELTATIVILSSCQPYVDLALPSPFMGHYLPDPSFNLAWFVTE